MRYDGAASTAAPFFLKQNENRNRKRRKKQNMIEKQWIRVRVTGRSYSMKAGKIRLSKEQAADRSHAVKKTGGNTYEVRGLIQFKSGEEFELPKELVTKIALVSLTPVDEIKPVKKSAAAAPSQQEEPDEDEETTPPDAADPTANGLLNG
jgi:hypothetical protein